MEEKLSASKMYRNNNREQEIITSFYDSTEQYVTDVTTDRTDSTMNMADSDTYKLQDFLSRPIQIRSISWTPGNDLNIGFYPWDVFFKDKRIVNRMSNYRFIKGDLCVKFMINGNGFYYGRVLATYEPFYTVNDRPIQVDQSVLLCRSSQRPKLFLDPCSSQGGTMRIPLLWPTNGFSITEFSPQTIGRIDLRSFGTLVHANGSTNSINIQVWAWMENVRLEVPTSVEPSYLIPQSGEEEYTGIVSKPAAAVAAVAGKLTDLPVLGPYAKATHMVSSTVGNVARLFGYSKPNAVENIHMYTPRYLGNLASTQGVDTSTTLAGDPKRELTIDPSTLGLPNRDELHFKHLGNIESYIGTFSWDVTEAQETILNKILVTPLQFVRYTNPGDSTTTYQYASTGFMALPFCYWRGSLKFRFQIIASNFHRGRLRITYDPLAVPAEGTDENVVVNHIVDIADDKDFTIEVGWGTDRPWLETEDTSGQIPPFGSDADSVFDPYYHNGILSVSVLSKLTSPSDSYGVGINVNVFVSAGDDFEVAVPTLKNIQYMSVFSDPTANEVLKLRPQSGDVEDDSANAPMDNTTDTKLLVSDTIGSSQDVFFADPFVSFRTLLKRYTLADTTRTQQASLSNVKINFPHRPFYYGYDPDGIHNDTSDPPREFNFVHNNFVSFILSAYAVYRGSIRWKTYIGSPSSSATFRVAMNPQIKNSPYSEDVEPTGSTNSQWASSSLVLDSCATGALATSVDQNPILEFEAPWYTNTRFGLSQSFSVTTTDKFFPERGHSYSFTNDGAAYLERYVATGEDMICGFFLGMPPVQYVAPPSPATL